MHYNEFKRKLFVYEVLRARFEIREFYMGTAVREIYENIGQVLSLARIQLAILNPGGQLQEENISQSGELVAKSIRDLRALCRSVYPDNNLIQPGGIRDGLRYTLNILQPEPVTHITITGQEVTVETTINLISFKLLQEILCAIKKANEDFKKIIISYKKEQIEFIIIYTGEPIKDFQKDLKPGSEFFLSFNERVELIGGSYKCIKHKTGVTKISFLIPVKKFPNE